MSIRGDISYENTLQGELNKKRNLNGNVRRSAYNELMAATEEAKKAAQEAQEAAKVIEGLIGTNLFPDSFELWNGDGAILPPAIGSPLIGSVLEPKAVYRIRIVPGRSYNFTSTPLGSDSHVFFAVADKDGICLAFTTLSIDKYDVRSDYDGTVPAYIYYGVADINNISDIEFRGETPTEVGTIKVEQTSEGAIVTAIDKDGTTTAVIRNGKDGAKGADGKTPVKGVDYFTEEEIEDIVQRVLESLKPAGRTLNITTTCWGTSSCTSISLYINGEKQYTTPTDDASLDDIVYTNTFENVTEAYIVYEGDGYSNPQTEVNGNIVWTSLPAVGTRYDLLALNTDTINIRTNFCN